MSVVTYRTTNLKVNLGINLIYIAILLGFTLHSLFNTIKQIYIYYILNTPFDPIDPPLIMLGIIVTGFYGIGAIIFVITTYAVYKLNNVGRVLNLVLLPFALWLLFPISIVLVLFQGYVLLKDQPTTVLFQASDNE